MYADDCALFVVMTLLIRVAMKASAASGEAPASVFMQTFAVNPWPAPQLVKLWFDTPVPEEDAEAQVDTVRQIVIASGLPVTTSSNRVTFGQLEDAAASQQCPLKLIAHKLCHVMLTNGLPMTS